MTGEIDEGGLLEAASGETHSRIGVDSGLYPLLKDTVFGPSVTAGSYLQVRMGLHEVAAILWHEWAGQRAGWGSVIC